MYFIYAWTQSVQQRKGKVLPFPKFFTCSMLAVCLLFISNPPLLGQSSEVFWTIKDSCKIGYQFSSNADTFPAHERLAVSLFLEPTTPQACIGGEFVLDMSSRIDLDSNQPVTIPATSWLGLAAELHSNHTWTATTHSLALSLARLDGTLRSGSGQVLTTWFTVGDTALPATEAVQAMGGGIIIEDNIDMKQAQLPGKPVPEATVWPNPFWDRVEVACPAGRNWMLLIRDQQGNLVWQSDHEAGKQLRLGSLAPGIYYFSLVDDTGRARHPVRVLKR